MTGHSAPVRSVAPVIVDEGRALIVSGSDDHTPPLGALTGQPVGDPLPAHTSESPAVSRPGNGDSLIISGGKDGGTVLITNGSGHCPILLWPLSPDGHSITDSVVNAGR